MLTQNTLDTLRRLMLTGMSDALEHQRAQPDTHDLAFEDQLVRSMGRRNTICSKDVLKEQWYGTSRQAGSDGSAERRVVGPLAA